MAWRERTRGEDKSAGRGGARRGTLDLRLDAADRPGSAPDRRAAPPPRPSPRQDSPRQEGSRKDGPQRGRRASKSGGVGSIGRLVYWAVVGTVWLALAVIGLVVWQFSHLPPIQSLEVPKRPPTVQIIGIDGKPLATRGEMGGAAVPLNTLPAYLPNAFIAIEDRRFRSHFGIDPIGIGRAVITNLLHRGVSQGGSTLTQQLAKNLFLTQERTISRKLQEVALALWLEHRYSKDQILELYLNRVYFGAGAYGVEAAAQRYFGKPAQKLTISESAMLAGLVKAPARLAPTRHPAAAQRRANVVIGALVEQNFISQQAALGALSRPANVVKRQDPGSLGYVADWVMDALNDLVGHIEDDLNVITTIDPVLQQSAERALAEALARDGDRQDIGQGALVALAPDGAVRALVGGRNYAESQYNRAVTARRQPGSAFKPFVYLTALENGLTPDTVRDDSPVQVKGWKPENYRHEYRGPVTLTTALANSINTVAVRLVLELGPPQVVRTAQRLGIRSPLEPNATLALGTSEVSLLELVTAYASFANGGLPAKPVVVERVRTAAGKTLYLRRPDPRGRAIATEQVAMMNYMLEQVMTNGTGRRAQLPGWQAAGKTGTTQESRDAWFVGYTGRLVAGVWLGNDDSSPMKKVTGSGLPIDIWARFMREAHRGLAPTDLPGGALGPVASWGPRETPPLRAPTLPFSGESWFDRLFGRRP